MIEDMTAEQEAYWREELRKLLAETDGFLLWDPKNPRASLRKQKHLKKLVQEEEDAYWQAELSKAMEGVQLLKPPSAPVETLPTGRPAQWRQGGKDRRALFVQYGPEPSDKDELAGFMERPVLAKLVVRAMNEMIRREAGG